MNLPKLLTARTTTPFAFPLIASLIGWRVGGFLVGFLRTTVSYDSCELSQLGMLFTYDCPWWHPDNYYIWFWILGIILTPILLNVTCTKFFKMKPFSIWSISIAIIVTLIIMFTVSQYLENLIYRLAI